MKAALLILALFGCVAASQSIAPVQEVVSAEVAIQPVGFKLASETSNEFDDNEQFSEFALIPMGQDEVKYLSSQNRIFAPYCTESRDEVALFMEDSADKVASRVFNIMFNSVGEIGAEALNQTGEALKKGVEKIRAQGLEPDAAEFEPKIQHPTTKSEVLENLQEGQKQVEQGFIGGLWRGLVETGKAAVQAVFNAFLSETAVRIALLKQEFAIENIPTHINAACGKLSFDLKSKLEKKLHNYIRQIKAEDTDNKFGETLRTARIENVGCVTTGRVVKAAALCDCLRIAGPTLYPLMGL